MLRLCLLTGGERVLKPEYAMVAVDHPAAASGIAREARVTNRVDVPRDDSLSMRETGRHRSISYVCLHRRWWHSLRRLAHSVQFVQLEKAAPLELQLQPEQPVLVVRRSEVLGRRHLLDGGPHVAEAPG